MVRQIAETYLISLQKSFDILSFSCQSCVPNHPLFPRVKLSEAKHCLHSI